MAEFCCSIFTISVEKHKCLQTS